MGRIPSFFHPLLGEDRRVSKGEGKKRKGSLLLPLLFAFIRKILLDNETLVFLLASFRNRFLGTYLYGFRNGKNGPHAAS